jgi:hypothetical protein
MTIRILTQRDLGQEQCANPNCTCDDAVIYPGQRCHQGAGFAAGYNKHTGVLILSCAVCDKEILGVEVAKGPLLQ